MKNLTRSRIFRYGVAYAALFFVSSLVVLLVLFSFAFGLAEKNMKERLELESVWLQEILASQDEFNKVSLVNDHIADHPGSLGIYLLQNPEGRRLAGNLDFIPARMPDSGEFLEFKHQDDRENLDPPLNILATRVGFSDGSLLLVGATTSAIDQIKREITPAALTALFLSLVLGTLVATFLARRLAQRLEKINQTSHTILEGNLSTRMEKTGSGDEFDRLSGNLNHMLDRIFHLMDSIRGVTDNIAHDLRSPLSRMRSRMEVALISDRSPGEYQEVLAETVEDTDRLLTTFNSLLTLAKMESGPSGKDFKTVDLTELLTDIVDFYQPLVEEQGHRLTNDISQGLRVNGNPDLLAQAMANLLDNAIKYTNAAGVLELKAQVEDEHGSKNVVIAVADNGPGIPAHFRQKALERFTRLDGSRNTPGQGLGLSLVKLVAEKHGGRLLLQDARPGLLVRLELPPWGTDGN